MNYTKSLCFIILLIIVLLTKAGYAYEYTAYDLGTLGGTSTYVYDINDNSQVVGASYNNSGQFHGFIWDSTNGMQDIGTLGGASSNALAIDNSGRVVGNSTNSSNALSSFIWDSSNGMQDVGLIGLSNSNAINAMNNFGQVAGYSVSNRISRSFIWDRTNGAQSLGNFGRQSWAEDINDSGKVVGTYEWTGINCCGHAFIWDKTNGMQDIGTLLSGYSGASAINNLGEVVGSYDQQTSSRGFIWSSANGAQDIGSLGNRTKAYAINDLSMIVGTAEMPDQSWHAFVWDRVNGMLDINSLLPANSGWTLTSAIGINNNGDIIGSGKAIIGYTTHPTSTEPVPIYGDRIFIAKLVQSSPVAPEPISFILFAIGGAILCSRRYFKKRNLNDRHNKSLE